MKKENSILEPEEKKHSNMLNYRELREIMDSDEAADLLRISKSRLYQMTSKNEIPFYKQGQRVVFSRSKIMAWLEKFAQVDIKTANESADEFIASNRK